MSLYDSKVFSSVGKISLDDLAGLLSGGKNTVAFDETYQPRLHKDFPRGDARLIERGDNHGTSKIYHSTASDYLKASFPKYKIPPEIAYPSKPEDLIKRIELLEAENLTLKAVKQVPEVMEDKPLTNCDKVTFGAVCYLLAKYGEIEGDKAFQAKGVIDLSPVANKISSEIEILASDITNANNSTDGFSDAGRRKSIGDALSAFLSQINKNKNS